MMDLVMKLATVITPIIDIKLILKWNTKVNSMFQNISSHAKELYQILLGIGNYIIVYMVK